MTIEREASEILLNVCTQCQKRIGCKIKEDGERPGLDDLGLPEEWGHAGCTEFLRVDTRSGELFL